MSDGLLKMGDGCHIAWTETGPLYAPPLILSNSLGTNRNMWLPQLDILSKNFRVIRYDTRGHGLSDVPRGTYSLDRLGRDVLELANYFELSDFSFCGLSLGGMTAQWLGVFAPERLRRLIIANSSPYMGPPSSWDERITYVLKNQVASIADTVIEKWFTEKFRENKKNDIESMRNVLCKTDVAGYTGCCSAIRDMDMRPIIHLITTPSLIIGGSMDPATPPSHTQELNDKIKNSRCVMLNSAHLSNIEEEIKFNKNIMDFLV